MENWNAYMDVLFNLQEIRQIGRLILVVRNSIAVGDSCGDTRCYMY